MEDINYGAQLGSKVAGTGSSHLPNVADADRDGYGRAKLTLEEESSNPWIERDIHNPLLSDSIENKTDSHRKLEHETFFFLKTIKVPEPQIMRRFIAACMEKNVNEKDLIWLYHMRDIPQNGTLPKEAFVDITKQQLAGNTEMTLDKDYEILAESYLGYGGDYVLYVTMCNHLHELRVKFNNHKESPLKQTYPPYRYPQTGHYPRPPQGDWHKDGPRREQHALPTVTINELMDVSGILRRMGQAVYAHKKYPALEDRFYEQEKLKENESVECGLVPHDYAKRIFQKSIPLDLTDRELQILSLYYEHPFILHFFRYRDFLMDLKYEMGQIDPKYKETSEQVRLKAILLTIKRYLYNHGVNMLEPLKDFDTFGEGRLNKSQTLRALHLLRISPGQRCDISDQDLDFLLNAYSTDGNFVDYKAMVTELSQVFVERFEPGGRLSMVMESFEPNLTRGPFYPARAPLITRQQILKRPCSNQELLDHVINRLKMLVTERRMCLEPIITAFDLHHIRYIQHCLTVPRILQLCSLPVTQDEADVIIERFSDAKGFRYMEFLQAIDTSSYAFRSPTYPLTVATMEKWKHRCAWYPEVIPQDPYQNYQGPKEIIEKCRRKIAVNRLRVSDFFIDQNFHHRGTVTRKQFRRATTNMRLDLSPIENLILEDRYPYPPDLGYIDFRRFVRDMDAVYAPKDVGSFPALIPEKYHLAKVRDSAPISEGQIALAQEGFRKIVEKMLELRIQILPYFQDFDPWRRGVVMPNCFRRILNNIGIDVLTEFEWRAVLKYFTRASHPLFDYNTFFDGVNRVQQIREKTVDPRQIPVSS